MMKKTLSKTLYISYIVHWILFCIVIYTVNFPSLFIYFNSRLYLFTLYYIVSDPSWRKKHINGEVKLVVVLFWYQFSNSLKIFLLRYWMVSFSKNFTIVFIITHKSLSSYFFADKFLYLFYIILLMFLNPLVFWFE